MRPDLPASDDTFLIVADIGCGLTRRALLGLEPGSRIWLEIEGEPLLFERATRDLRGESGPILIPVQDSAEVWQRLVASIHPMVMEIDFIERPADRPDLGRS